MEIFKIHENLLSSVLCFVRMSCQILFTVFFWCNDLKRFIIPEHNENNIADLVHNSSDSNALFLAGTFMDVIIINDRIYKYFCSFLHFQVVYGDHMQDTPGKAGTPLGHVDPVSMEFAGIIYTETHPKVSIEFLWGRKQVKGPHFGDQDNCAEEADAPEGLEKADTVINRIALQFIQSLMQFFQYTVQMCLVFPVHFYVQPDPDSVAWKGTSKNSGIFCGNAYSVMFGKGVFFAETSCIAYGFHKFVLLGLRACPLQGGKLPEALRMSGLWPC